MVERTERRRCVWDPKVHKLSFIDYILHAGSCSADVASASDGAAELGIGNVGGVFVVLICGCSAACILGIIEFLWNIKAIAIEERVKLLY